MSDAVLNVVIGLVTSVVSGGSVWAWKRVSAARVLHRKRAPLGLRPGVPCVVILNSHWQMAAVTEHGDVYAIIELAMLAEESGCAFTLVAADAPELNGDRTELSIGGLGSNRRNVEYLARYLPGVRVNERGDFSVGGERFPHTYGRTDHALVAKSTPPQSAQPVLMITGQSAIANRAAVHLDRGEVIQLVKSRLNRSGHLIKFAVTSLTVIDDDLGGWRRANPELTVRRPAPARPDPPRPAGAGRGRRVGLPGLTAWGGPQFYGWPPFDSIHSCSGATTRGAANAPMSHRLAAAAESSAAGRARTSAARSRSRTASRCSVRC